VNEDAIAVFIPLTAIFMSLLIPIVFAIVDYKRRRDIVEANHKERMAAIERGMEAPQLPESFYLAMKPARRSTYLLPGLIWLFVGIGLFVALGAVAGNRVLRIPAGVSLAFLICTSWGRNCPRVGRVPPSP
jgi:hypothetical protein